MGASAVFRATLIRNNGCFLGQRATDIGPATGVSDEALLRERFGFSSFRPGQREVLRALWSMGPRWLSFPAGPVGPGKREGPGVDGALSCRTDGARDRQRSEDVLRSSQHHAAIITPGGRPASTFTQFPRE